MDTTTTQYQGQAPGRARRGASPVVACPSWREHTVASAAHRSGISGVAAVAMHAYLGNTTTTAGAENLSFTKRPARHLAVGST